MNDTRIFLFLFRRFVTGHQREKSNERKPINPEEPQDMVRNPAPVWNGATRRGAGRQMRGAQKNADDISG